MAYTIPIFDRTILDVIGKTSKGYLNLSDWDRIDDNTAFVVALILSIFSSTVSQTTLATMSTASIPTVDEVNDLAGNIEAMRTWVATNYPTSTAATDPDFTDVKDDYASGDAQDYETVNHWEQVVDIAYQWLDDLELVRFPRSGVAGAGRGLTRNNSFRG